MTASPVTNVPPLSNLASVERPKRRPRFRSMGLAGAGAIILLLMVVIGIAAPVIAPADPKAVSLVDRLKPPLSPGHILGTDALGQDVLTRVIYGARISTLVGFVGVAISGIIGMALGLLAGFYGKWLDDIIMRIGDIQLAFPTIILYVAVMAVRGPGLVNLIVVIGVVGWVQYGRIQRGMVLAERQREYVEAAKVLGVPDWAILLRHILPNTLGPIMVVASFGLANIIITEASLSFLGLGVPPSVPSWGSMLSDGRDYLRNGWWIATFPGVAITVTVLAINLVGDWLRDHFDPLLRTR